MKLKNVLRDLDNITLFNDELLETEIKGLTLDSRQAKTGDLFAALDGVHTRGANYVAEALKKGSAAVMISASDAAAIGDKSKIFAVGDSRLAFAKLAANFYENPTKDLLLIGVTGTNGKTTITYLLESIFNINNVTGVIGTINYRFNSKVIPAMHTTPPPHELMKILSEMRDRKVKVVLMETSSHSLDQRRVDGCEFDCGIFTNLTQEHLDYHGSMENYFNAKARLFTEILPLSPKQKKYSIINIDDEWVKKLADFSVAGTKTVKCSMLCNADIFVGEVNMSAEKTKFVCDIFGKKEEFEMNLIGRYNVSNAMLSIAAASCCGAGILEIKKGLLKVSGIPGRLQTLHSRKGFMVVIDYAHTPDAIIKVISSLKELKHRRLITVFGCGGDRDRTKRPLMGAAASSMSDFVIVTSDNPRTEDPYKILLDIEIGIKKIGAKNYKSIIDRKEAIEYAVNMASEGDIILLAGKGHETYQIIGSERKPFSDCKVASEMI